MEGLLFLVSGVLIALLLGNKTIKIKIIHLDETPQAPVMSQAQMDVIMASGDHKEDKAYENMGATIKNITDIMSGDDR